MNSTLRLASVFAIVSASISAQDRAIDIRHSTITIHVGKAGVFSAAGHEHWVNAPIASGTINESAAPRVEFKVNAARIEVKPDPKVSAKDQAEIQKTMQETVLESEKYPEVVFRSSHVEKQSSGGWQVMGLLTLHGVTKPVTMSVQRSGDAYVSHAIIKQTDYGIKPVKVGGGAIKVKDELDLQFHIVTRSE